MTQIQFHETYMGAQFYRKTLPDLVKQLTRVADAMERLAATAEAGADAQGPDSQGPNDSDEGEPGRPDQVL